MITTTDPAPIEARTAAGINATYVWIISAVAAMGGLLFGSPAQRSVYLRTRQKPNSYQ